MLKGTAFTPVSLDKYYLLTCFFFFSELSKREESKLFRSEETAEVDSDIDVSDLEM